MALANMGHEEIIDYYYSGAEVKTLAGVGAEAWLSEPGAIWVGLSQDDTTRTFEVIGGPADVCLTGDGTDTCEASDLTLVDGDVLTVAVQPGSDPSRCELTVDSGDPVEGDCWLDLTWTESVESSRVKFGAIEYARGSIHVRPNSHDPNMADAFHTSVSLDLESYIYGIAETLLHWEDETLKTQAIIARSYGARRAMEAADGAGALIDSRKDKCWCHIGSTSSDQNYDGWSGGLPTEGDPVDGQSWRAAVDGTTDMIVTHPENPDGPDSIINTFYSSSTGGATESNEDVWNGGPLPWLRSVDDPWSVDPAVNNPLASWTILVNDDDIARYLGWDRALDARMVDGPPGALVEFTGIESGKSVTMILTGWQVRSLLNSIGYRSDGARVRVSPYVISVEDPPGFDDIIGHLFEGDIEWLFAEGITKGCNPPDNTLYCPGDPVSRGAMAAFLNRALDLPPATQDHFSDDDGSTFENDINAIAQAGITKGCNPPANTSFCPDDVVDRGQMAAFLVRALGLTDGGSGDLFIDDDHSIFERDIDRLGTAGITRGCNPPVNDRYCPGLPVDRGQMAAFLHRAIGDS
jgi:hypothetical protein